MRVKKIRHKMAKRPDGFRLNEPATPVAGGSRRPSLLLNHSKFLLVRQRERLNRILIIHDSDGPQPTFSLNDMAIVRQIAREGALANHVPALRRNAMLVLAGLPSPENLELLTELALGGEDFYVRGHAMLALGQLGWIIVAPLLRDGLKAKELFERQAAEAGLLALGRENGPSVLRAILETEKDKGTREALDRILARLGEQRLAPKTKQRVSSKRRGQARR
jgi:hypothetical protein